MDGLGGLGYWIRHGVVWFVCLVIKRVHLFLANNSRTIFVICRTLRTDCAHFPKYPQGVICQEPISQGPNLHFTFFKFPGTKIDKLPNLRDQCCNFLKLTPKDHF